jgi:hypothetical protein
MACVLGTASCTLSEGGSVLRRLPPSGGDVAGYVAQECDELAGEWREVGVGAGHGVDVAVRPRLRQVTVGGAGDAGQGQAGDQRHADAGADQGLGMGVLLHAESDPVLRTALGLDQDSRVLLIGGEGATDPAIYENLVGQTPGEVFARQDAVTAARR